MSKRIYKETWQPVYTAVRKGLIDRLTAEAARAANEQLKTQEALDRLSEQRGVSDAEWDAVSDARAEANKAYKIAWKALCAAKSNANGE